MLPSREARPKYVAEMFGRIASRYDLMNTLMTFGMDRGWRRYTARQAAPPPDGLVLDVGAGTGKLSLALAKRMPRGRVVACDFTQAMLVQGKRSLTGRASKQVTFHRCDALCLPYRDGVFDCVVSGFTVRNLADMERGFREMARVTRAGGQVVCLEVTSPALAVFSPLFRLYFRRLVPLLGRLVAREADAYTYLPESAAAFPSPERVAAAMVSTGLTGVRWRRLGFGAVAVHTGAKG